MANQSIAGVDGCKSGWVAVVDNGREILGLVATSIDELLSQLPDKSLVTVDIPIGLPDIGWRSCDIQARRRLGSGRASSVFPAPIRPVLEAANYLDACSIREALEGKRMSQQAYAILPKIREVDTLLRLRPEAWTYVREVHPEVSFAHWNAGQPMRVAKKKAAGRAEREELIDDRWPNVRRSLLGRWPRNQVGRDDLNDAFAALWTAERIINGTAERIPETIERDAMGLTMEMWV